jgi:tetratricopeptide (TPR) repeat protein
MAQKIPLQAKLLLGIFLVLAFSAFVYFRIQGQRQEALKEQAQSPRARVELAISRAQRATINKEFRAAETAYVDALDTIGEVLREKPGSLKLKRSQLFVLRQLSHWTSRRKDEKATYTWALQAVNVAKSILEARPTETRARRDRIATAVTFAQSGSLAEPDALETLKEAIVQVGSTTPDARPAPPVREMLARAWRQIGKRHGTEKNYAAAYEALKTALQWAQSGTSADQYQATLKSLTYKIAEAGNEIAATQANKKMQQAFQAEVVKALLVGSRLNSKNVVLQSMLATRRARLADLLQAQGDLTGAEKLYADSVASLEAAIKAHPKLKRLTLSWVRALNHQGAFYSELKNNEAALATYKKAFETSAGLQDTELRTRLISMGNYAQLLGRLDRTAAARGVAAEAFELAVELRKQALDDQRALEDKQSAALRLARLLRARPKARKKKALRLALATRKSMVFSDPRTSRQKSLKKGLDLLISELRNQ